MLGKDLLGLYDTSAEDIVAILDTAVGMKKLLTQNLKKLPHLQGRTVTTLFYENSTRTRCSFELAAKYLGAGTVNISASSSSVQKGETLLDTGRTLDRMGTDVIIIRHPMSGAPHLLAQHVNAAVINAAIDKAVAECKAQGIHGKATTPFLLARIKDITGGDSLDSNIQLVFNNARVAAKTAAELSKLA